MIYGNAYQVTHLTPTNTLGTRVKITELESGRKWVLPFDYAIGSANIQARAFIEEAECNILAGAPNQDGDFIYITQYPMPS